MHFKRTLASVGVFLWLGAGFASATPVTDTERSLSRLDKVVRLKSDFRDKRQVQTATKEVDRAKRMMRSLTQKATKIKAKTTDSKVRDKRRRLVDKLKRFERALEAKEDRAPGSQ